MVSMPVSPNALEIPFPPEFGAEVAAKRRAKGWSQARLGAAVGVSQAVISDIERGIAGSSTAVQAICETLEMAIPVATDSDDERRWIDAGRALRARRPRLFAQQLAFVETVLAEEGPVNPESPRSH